MAVIGLLLLPFLPSTAYASIVLLARGEDRIFVAADTRGTAPNPDRKPYPACKVLVSEDAAIAVIGIKGMPGLQIDIFDPLRQLLDRQLAFPELLDALDTEMATYLPAYIDAALRYDPALAPLLQHRRGLFLGMAVIGVQDGIPVWRVRHYTRVVRNDTVRIRHRDRSCGKDCVPGATDVLDGTRAVRRELRKMDKEKLTREWPREARRLIGLAAQESRSIGLPAVSLEVTADGVRWLEQHPVCETP